MVNDRTMKRGPVAAASRGPGPCYGLPSLTGYENHDPRYKRNPAYQIGQPHSAPTIPSGPGPCYYPDPKICRNGVDGTPKYSLYSKQKEMEAFKTPGPGSYVKQSGKWIIHQHAPAFSFGAMFPVRSEKYSPGPGAYSIPNVIGKTVQSNKSQAPVYSIYGRSKTGNFYDDMSKTPGPGAYSKVSNDAFLRSSPRYSMKGRDAMPGDSTQRPGPGSHYPEKVIIHKPIQPSYSMGIRHSEYMLPVVKIDN